MLPAPGRGFGGARSLPAFDRLRSGSILAATLATRAPGARACPRTLRDVRVQDVRCAELGQAVVASAEGDPCRRCFLSWVLYEMLI